MNEDPHLYVVSPIINFRCGTKSNKRKSALWNLMDILVVVRVKHTLDSGYFPGHSDHADVYANDQVICSDQVRSARWSGLTPVFPSHFISSYSLSSLRKQVGNSLKIISFSLSKHNIFGLVSCMPAFPVAARVNWLPPSFLRFAPGRPLPPKQLVRSLGQLGRQRRRSGSQNALQHSACVVHIPDLPGVRRSGGFSRLQGAAKGAKTPPNLFSSITCTTFEWVVQIIKLKRFKDAPQTELERKWNLSCYSCSSLETTIHITFGTTLILRLSLH
jgi:hypothetical protein